VLSFRWSKTHQTVDTSTPDKPLPPARAMTPNDKAYARSARINDPAGKRDPNEDTVDARSVALEQSVRAAEKPGQRHLGPLPFRRRSTTRANKLSRSCFGNINSRIRPIRAT
jgi:hypothetical protein